MKFKRRTTIEKAPTITEVRRAHDQYGAALARWGDNNIQTQVAMNRYYELKNKWQAANPDKSYSPFKGTMGR